MPCILLKFFLRRTHEQILFLKCETLGYSLSIMTSALDLEQVTQWLCLLTLLLLYLSVKWK